MESIIILNMHWKNTNYSKYAWGVRGERLKKLFEFFYPFILKDEVFKTERQFSPFNPKLSLNNN
jgi:hypothetical protein